MLKYLLSKLKHKNMFYVDLTDNSKRTPLSYACDRGHLSTVKLLLKEGADPEAQDVNGITPIVVACKNGWKECVLEMLKNGASCDVGLVVAASCGHEEIVIDVMKSCSNDIVCTALETAAARGQDHVVNAMLTRLQNAPSSTDRNKRSGVDLSFQITSMLSPLVAAASFGNAEAARIILDKSHEFTGLLSLKEVMSEAALGSHTNIVKLLLRHGAAVREDDEESQTSTSEWNPLQCAEIAGASDIANLLRATTQGTAVCSFLRIAQRGSVYEIRKTIARLDAWIAQRSRRVSSPSLGFFSSPSLRHLNLSILLPRLASSVLSRHAEVLKSAHALRRVLVDAHDRTLNTFDV